MDKIIPQYDDNFMPGEIFNIEFSNVATEMASVTDSSLVFDEDADIQTTPVPGRNGMAYVNLIPVFRISKQPKITRNIQA